MCVEDESFLFIRDIEDIAKWSVRIPLKHCHEVPPPPPRFHHTRSEPSVSFSYTEFSA